MCEDAGGGSLSDALELLNQAVTVAPNYASPYNIQSTGEREKERDSDSERDLP